MTIYSVYLPPMDADKQGEEFLQLVPDKKSPWALFIPIFWLLYHRLWLSLLAYIVVTSAILLLFSIKPHPAIMYLSVLPGLYLLFEGQELVRSKLERKGWNFAGVVDAENNEEAEIRYLTSRENLTTASKAASVNTHQGFRTTSLQSQGLFPE